MAALAYLGAEDANSQSRKIYLVTLSRVLPQTVPPRGAPALVDPSGWSREAVRDAMLDACRNPLQPAAGAAGRHAASSPDVDMMWVFLEEHLDGSKHFHVAVKLDLQYRFINIKRALRVRHGLASHWSATHTQWWSAVRYCAHESPKKPMAQLDASPLPYAKTRREMDRFEQSQEPFNAEAWRKRREKADNAAASESRSQTFSKLDFNALVLSKNLRTKKRILAYVQESGTVAMQSFIAKNQYRLESFLKDALEWEAAPAAAAAETLTDWALVCKTAQEPCAAGTACAYAAAARHFFEVNEGSFSMTHLAAALRAVIVQGPTKQTRVPFLVGPTNSGKTTLIDPFDDLFGEDTVFHLPALTDTRGYALRNWLRNKRFVLWDEFEPVAYAAAGVIPKPQFLKAFTGQKFEVQVSQSNNDGNADFRWSRGAVFTSKGGVEIWKAIAPITDEDVRHMRERVQEFQCVQAIQQRPGGVPRCKHCLASWIFKGALQSDAEALVAFVGPSQAPPAHSDGDVQGFSAAMDIAKLPQTAVSALRSDVVRTGAISIHELRRTDWELLPAFQSLKELEKRRLLAALRL